jgi:hypothetical protein
MVSEVERPHTAVLQYLSVVMSLAGLKKTPKRDIAVMECGLKICGVPR